MRYLTIAFALTQLCFSAFSQTIPVISTQPQSQTIADGSSATFSVVSSNATSYQWRFDGADIAGATNSTLQATQEGYYVVIAKNAIGWVPSQMVFLTVLFSSSNSVNPPWTISVANNSQNLLPDPLYGGNYTGSATVMAGSQLDQLQPAGSVSVVNGHFSGSVVVSNASIFKVPLYCAVYVGAPYYTFPSTVVSYPLQPGTTFHFPQYLEWPEPYLVPQLYDSNAPQRSTLVQVPGENATLTIYAVCDEYYAVPTLQWRKDGVPVQGVTSITFTTNNGEGAFNNNFIATLTLTNIQAANAGVYDAEIFGDNWLISSKIQMSVQLTNGVGQIKSTRFVGANFAADLVGAPYRDYTIQWSSNLTTWNDLITISNTSGTVSFTNSPGTNGTFFYRSKLLP